jgi:hypothetical protein
LESRSQSPWRHRADGFSSATGPTAITVTGNPWTDNQFNRASGSYYVEVVSGVNSGALSDITATAAF